jgi:hypothetical protein
LPAIIPPTVGIDFGEYVVLGGGGGRVVGGQVGGPVQGFYAGLAAKLEDGRIVARYHDTIERTGGRGGV